MPSPFSFDEFYDKLKDIVNFTFNLGATIPKPKVVRNVLRFLPERFHAKITAIEESKDIDKIPLIELVGNLQTYELGLTRKSKALGTTLSDTEPKDDSDGNDDEGILNALTAIVDPTNGVSETIDDEEDLVDSKFEKMND